MEFRRGACNHGYCVQSPVSSQIDIDLLGREGILKGLKRCVDESRSRVFRLSIYDVVCVATKFRRKIIGLGKHISTDSH